VISNGVMMTDVIKEDSIASHGLFNTPLECGFRILFTLNSAFPKSADLQRLVSYDYLVVHTDDIQGGPTSLHPSVPYRGSEWVVKRNLVLAGVNLMFARELLVKKMTSTGIEYSGSELTSAFIDLLQSQYSHDLNSRADWVIKTFGKHSDVALQNYMTEHVGKWGAEFEQLPALNELELL